MEDLNYLILVRHGQSEWNAKNLFTGWKDPDLTDQGRDEAEKAGKLLLEKKIDLDELFTSVLIRAINTGNIILDQLGIESLPTTRDQSLNAVSYTHLTLPTTVFV